MANYYGVLPAPVRYADNIGEPSKIVYAELTATLNMDGFSTATNEQIGADLGRSVEMVAASISVLEDHKFVKIHYGKDGQRKIYPIHL